jgi:hypothetical protein
MGYNSAMILTEAPIRTPEQVVASMERYTFSNLEIYTKDQEIFEQLPARNKHRIPVLCHHRQ